MKVGISEFIGIVTRYYHQGAPRHHARSTTWSGSLGACHEISQLVLLVTQQLGHSSSSISVAVFPSSLVSDVDPPSPPPPPSTLQG